MSSKKSKTGITRKKTTSNTSAKKPASKPPVKKVKSKGLVITKPRPTANVRRAASEHLPSHSVASANQVTTSQKSFTERRRLENDNQREFQQGALFMDEYETYQEGGFEGSDDATDTERSGADETLDAPLASEAAAQPKRADERRQDAGRLEVRLSNSLYRKLIAKAEMEGVTVDEFAGELLAEGLVLRAWEIMERKTAMRGGNNASGNGNNYNAQNRQQNRYGFRGGQNHHNNAGGNNGGNHNYNGRNRMHGNSAHGNGNHNNNAGNHGGGQNRRLNYSNIMEDSANFLEYVRSQEKKQK